jgi:hypothetical protein
LRKANEKYGWWCLRHARLTATSLTVVESFKLFGFTGEVHASSGWAWSV